MTAFECEMSIPADPQFAETLRLAVAQVARQSGASEADAASFGADVERAWRECLGHAAGHVDIVLHASAAEVEAVLECGRTIRVARALPLDV